MPPPKSAPPAGAAASPSQPVCGLCGEEALEAEADLVEVFCNQGECVDAAGRRYHRDCMLTHLDKSGRIRKQHGHNDLRQIKTMELSGTLWRWTLVRSPSFASGGPADVARGAGFHCVHSHGGDKPCKGRIKGSLLILQVRKKAAKLPQSQPSASAPKPPAAKPPPVSRKVRLWRQRRRSALRGACAPVAPHAQRGTRPGRNPRVPRRALGVPR